MYKKHLKTVKNPRACRWILFGYFPTRTATERVAFAWRLDMMKQRVYKRLLFVTIIHWDTIVFPASSNSQGSFFVCKGLLMFNLYPSDLITDNYSIGEHKSLYRYVQLKLVFMWMNMHLIRLFIYRPHQGSCLLEHE